jgi:hypothetical protein
MKYFSLALCILLSSLLLFLVGCGTATTITISRPPSIVYMTLTTTSSMPNTSPTSTTLSTTSFDNSFLTEYFPLTSTDPFSEYSGFRIVISGSETITKASIVLGNSYDTYTSPAHTYYTTETRDITFSGEYTTYDNLGSSTFTMTNKKEYFVNGNRITCKVKKTSQGDGTLTVIIYTKYGQTPLRASSTNVYGGWINISYP